MKVEAFLLSLVIQTKLFTGRISDASVSNKGEKPGYHRQWAPDYAMWKPLSSGINVTLHNNER